MDMALLKLEITVFITKISRKGLIEKGNKDSTLYKHKNNKDDDIHK